MKVPGMDALPPRDIFPVRRKGGVPHPARPRETVDTPFRPCPTLSHNRLGNGMLFFNPYHQES